MRHALTWWILGFGIWVVICAPATAQRKVRPKPDPLTRECGSEVPWSDSVSSALEMAKTRQRPVFWYVPTVRGSRMDRKPEIDSYMMAGLFNDPDVAAMLSRRFVPVKEIPRGPLQEQYNLKPLEFVEPGFLVLSPDGTQVMAIDEISSQSAEWLVAQCHAALEALGEPHSRLSEATLAAKDVGGLEFIEGLLLDGEVQQAWSEAEALAKVARLSPDAAVVMARAARRARREAEARSWLSSLGDDPKAWPPGTLEERMRLDLALGRAAEVVRLTDEAPVASAEARFFRGVALHMTQRSEDGTALWRELVATGESNPWTRKASAELQGLGPFARALERYRWLPDDFLATKPEGTRLPRDKGAGSSIGAMAVEILLDNQRSDGSWTDSYYDFGGTASLPNVHAACTALCAAALLEWRPVNPKAIGFATDQALTYLLDESHIVADDPNEIIWAHAYRLIFFDHYLDQDHAPRAPEVRKKAIEIVKMIQDAQLESGGWRHEYPNPMATATVIHALSRIREHKIPVPDQILTKAGAVMKQTRGADGTYSYGIGERGGSAVQFAAGRMPFCELGLLLTGASSQPDLMAAIDAGFEHHEVLAAVRKYDDHADRYGNGGFFFWYDLYGRVEAIQHVANAQKRDAYRDRMLGIVTSLTEIDGGFIDSHELGKTYGTAMGLLNLRALMPNP